MDQVEALAEALYGRIRKEQGYVQPGNLTLYPANLPGHKNETQDIANREHWINAVRQALADDLIRFGEGDPQTNMEAK